MIRRYQAARGDDIPEDDPQKREILFYMDQARGLCERGFDASRRTAKLTEIRDSLGHEIPDEIIREISADVHDLASYKRIAKKHIRPMLGAMRVTAVQPMLVDHVLSKMKDAGKSGSTRKHAYIVMNRAFRQTPANN